MTVVSMSNQEFSRLQVLLDVQSGRLRIEDAAQLIGLGRRQIFRLLKGVRETGPAGLISRHRGRPSNRRLLPEYRELAMALVRERYADFGPTLAAEKLTELHGFGVSRETLRHWMIEDGLWIDRRRRLPPVHQPRNRRECLGELVQIDGSDHALFEDRRPRCTLIAFIDDATSRLMALRFVGDETTFDYFRVTRTYLESWGKPIAFYSDKFSVFRVYKRDAEGGNGMTQFGRALHELNIDIICANSPQAKGRVERAFGTLQDRLVKELRLAAINTIEAANEWLPTFTADAPSFAATVLSMENTIGLPSRVLADTGYASGPAVADLQARHIEPLVAIGRTQPQRPYDFRPPPKPKTPRKITEPWRIAMKAKLETEDAKNLYKKRKQTVEPVFGIIKTVIGFRKFNLRGLKNAATEWTLVALAYNCKRINRLKAA
jgi:hypothetical protein